MLHADWSVLRPLNSQKRLGLECCTLIGQSFDPLTRRNGSVWTISTVRKLKVEYLAQYSSNFQVLYMCAKRRLVCTILSKNIHTKRDN